MAVDTSWLPNDDWGRAYAKLAANNPSVAALFNDPAYRQKVLISHQNYLTQQSVGFPLGTTPVGGGGGTTFQNPVGGNVGQELGFDILGTGSEGGGNEGGGTSFFDSLFGKGGGGGGSSGDFDWTKFLVTLGLDLAANKFLGGKTSEEKALREFSTAPFESGNIQQFLPPALREPVTGPMLLQAMRQIGQLLQRPGGLSPGVSEAILPRLSAESQSIGQNFRNLQSNQAGAAARGNAPISIKNALASALDVAQERAQRGARQAALTESEGLRREDLGQTYKLLDTLLQFTSSGRGQAIPGLTAAAESAQRRQAGNLEGLGTLFSTINTR